MAAPVRVGDVLAEKYEVTKVLGEGGMGVVVAARHLELDKLVALKFMHEDVARSGQSTDRFLREARAAARLTNEHVGRVLDVGRLPGGVPYIVMEYLEGRDLGSLLAERGPLDPSEACEYVLQTCEAMAEAHAQGIIHRDLKPENLFLTMRQDGRPLVKVLDFGISKATHAKGPTGTYTALGTPTHMSPEQMKSSRTVDQRADIWSLGIILYQLLSGRVPFDGDEITEIMFKVLQDPLPPLARARPGLPTALVAAVEKCLEKDRDNRFENVAELAQILVPFAPERARAAISLIERVMSANVPAPTPSPRQTTDDDVVPRVGTIAVDPTPATAGAPTVVAKPVEGTRTTLGTAAGQSIENVRARGSRRWIAPIALLVAAAPIAYIVTRDRSADTPAQSSGADPANTPATLDAIAAASLDATVVDATVASAIDATLASTIDANVAIDAAAPPDARRKTLRDASPRATDATPMVSPPIDADAWKPEPPRLDDPITPPR